MDPVETHDTEGVDYGWVMQTTFVVTILVGAPLVAVLAVVRPLPTWGDRALFAVRVGAVVWFLTALAVYGYAVVNSGSNDADTNAADAGTDDPNDTLDEETPAGDSDDRPADEPL